MSRSSPLGYDQASEAAELVSQAASGAEFDVALVLGSGLEQVAERLSSPVVVSYADIPHFPRTTVSGHAGRLVFGRLGGASVAVLQGRFHHYEGHPLDAVTFPVRVLQRLGVPRLILTAATGGIRDDLGPGTIASVSDHLNFLGANPLRGPNDDRFGTRFPDLTDVYSSDLRQVARQVAGNLGIPLPEAVYACMPGPCYETPAEVRMLRILGADVVGMSTVPEAIVARHGGLGVLALSVVANWAAGISPTPLSHAEVLEAGRALAGRLAELLEGICARLAANSSAP